MFKPTQKIIVSCFLAFTLLAKAELPSLEETPWLGYFSHGKGKVSIVKVSSDGLITAILLERTMKKDLTSKFLFNSVSERPFPVEESLVSNLILKPSSPNKK